MEYVFKFNYHSADARVKALAAIYQKQNQTVADWHTDTPEKSVYYLEPRCQIDSQIFSKAQPGSLVFGYPQNLSVPAHVKYVSLNDDPVFIQTNNHLTALAMQKIIKKNYRSEDRRMLICGWGKLANELEKVFCDWEISILNFNFHKTSELKQKYGERAFFETAPFNDFPIIINTIPKTVMRPGDWKTGGRRPQIYDLASAPYGFDWDGVNQEDFNYQILPGLPGKNYPVEAAEAVSAAIARYFQINAKPLLAWCITGSACSFAKMLPIIQTLQRDFELIPVISPNADVPNRFVEIETLKQQIRALTGHEIITTIAAAEVLSANQRLCGSVIFPATGNTLAKLAHGITDTCVLMAVKALLRNQKPCVIALSTNDALSGNAKNIGELLNRKNIYFVPFGQDNPTTKPFSCVCDFNLVGATIQAALQGQQIQPILNKN